MSFAPLYLLNRLLFRISDFFHHWYVDGSRVLFHGFISFFEDMDQTFALYITLRYFWRPLYGDYTIMGHILGFFFRSARVILGTVFYSLCAVVMLAIYLAWIAAPFAILFMAYHQYVTNPS